VQHSEARARDGQSEGVVVSADGSAVAVAPSAPPSVLERFVMNEDTFIPSLIFVGIAIAIVMGTITKTVGVLARERTRREVAAYVAEGSMTPEQGERLLRAKIKES